MKKIFTTFLGIAICASVNAQSIKILTLGEGTPGIEEPQLMGLGISADGRYVCGSIEMGDGFFIADVENDIYNYRTTTDLEGAELRNISNNGIAIGYDGPGVTFTIDGVATELVSPSEEYKYILGEDISNDGSVMVGSFVAKGYATYAAYSKDGGEWTLLPEVPDELLGEYAGEGSAAKYVSGDGKVILGYIGNFGPATMWIMNDEGEYEVDPLFSKFMIMNEDDLANGEKRLLRMMAMGLSNNGKYAVFSGAIATEDSYRFVPVLYNVEEGSLIIYDDPQEIDMYEMGLLPSAVDDEGTIVGIIGTSMLYASTGSFILKAGESQASNLYEAFPCYGEIFEMSDMMGFCAPTGLSADGRYILGYGFYSDDFYDEEAAAYFATYIIDTKSGTSAIEMTTAEPNPTTPEAIYTIDGKRSDAMVKGLNIVRMSDGSVHKIFR